MTSAGGWTRVKHGLSFEYGLTSNEACREVGITYRNIDYWTRTGLISPSIAVADGSGTKRLFSNADICRLRIIKALLGLGVTLQQVRKTMLGIITEDGGRWAVLTSDGAVSVCAEGFLEDRCREAPGAVVIDLQAVMS